ncbi:hypothetical protein ElyMa_002015800 [Elysia marginata]|uniref:Uncharacterized protein n=1 Tax=Elysia marginata TaxID=1093978 RepID=A0AAV4F4K6_9GAST|nr:hypothetical protein ElyMa_002015800 [Elysia marginata]
MRARFDGTHISCFAYTVSHYHDNPGWKNCTDFNKFCRRSITFRLDQGPDLLGIMLEWFGIVLLIVLVLILASVCFSPITFWARRGEDGEGQNSPRQTLCSCFMWRASVAVPAEPVEEMVQYDHYQPPSTEVIDLTGFQGD